MAKRVNCKKGFKVIFLTPKEAKTIGFGIHEGCLCMECNNIIKDNIYYIAALNDVMNEECFNNWLETAINYSSDAILTIGISEIVRNPAKICPHCNKIYIMDK